MSKKGYPIVNFGKKYKEEVIGLATNTVSTFSVPNEIDGVNLSLRDNLFKEDTNLIEIDFNQCASIPEYCCSGCSNLMTITLPSNISSIGAYAFNNASKASFLGSFDLVPQIPNYAFYSAGSLAADGFTYKPTLPATVGSYAFRYSHLTELEGSISVGEYGFANNAFLEKAHLSLSGAIGQYAFESVTYVSDFVLNPESDITSIGSYAFQYFGYSRDNPVSNVFKWDLRQCGFTSVPSYCWRYNRASIFLLPKQVTSINTYAFANGSDITIYLNSLASLSATNAFQSTTNLSVIVNYELNEATLKSMTNWSTYASYIKSGITDYVGELPKYVEQTGLALTWYSDSAMTIPVTEAVDSNAIYYASKGLQREVWTVKGTSLVDADFMVTDGSTTYNDFVPVGATVTIIPVPTDPNKDQLYSLRVDGVDYTTEGSATIVADHDIKVAIMYWDGVNIPFWPNLADNDISMIKLASKLGAVPSTWLPGDEITVKYDGVDYRCRLVDTTGKFKRTEDGSTAYLSFEFVNLLPETRQLCDYTIANTGSGGSNNPTKFTLLTDMNSGDIWNKMDPDLKEILEPVDVVVGVGNAINETTTLSLKMFLARATDLTSPIGSITPLEAEAVAVDEYYQIHSSNSDRTKSKQGTTGAWDYWTMSPHYNTSSSYYWYQVSCYVKTVNGSVYGSYAGSIGTYDADTRRNSGGSHPGFPFAPRFAL